MADQYIYKAKKLEFEAPEDGDPLRKAAHMRRTMALEYYGSNTLGEEDTFTCSLLRRNLDNYSKIVDNANVYGSYKDQVMDLVSGHAKKTQWKSALTVDRVLSFIEPLPCSSTATDLASKINCVKLTGNSAKIIHKARSAFESDERKRKVAKVPAPAKIAPIQQKPLFRQKENVFRTGGEELRIQNLKKFGREESQGRSVGLVRPSGVKAPFKCPRNEEVNQVSQSGPSENGDERLKNIDPKMVETILNEIVYNGPQITWDDIAGLDYAKTTIQEVVIWPMLRPDIFTGLRRPPRGILLFGPPGTGKTLIGKCIANQSGATFFSISASSLTSKWVGEGEKMVRALFAVARMKQPSVVFIDEIDSILTQRSDTEHESSRRMKTEFLVQLDGVGTGEDERILIVGATNRPQELDEAARRRLVKRLYVPLPDKKARTQMVRNLMAKENHELREEDFTKIAELTDGYSGADMKHVCQEASLGPIRAIPPTQIRNIQSSQVRAVIMQDFITALTRVRSTVSDKDLNHYLEWDKQYGSGCG